MNIFIAWLWNCSFLVIHLQYRFQSQPQSHNWDYMVVSDTYMSQVVKVWLKKPLQTWSCLINNCRLSRSFSLFWAWGELSNTQERKFWRNKYSSHLLKLASENDICNLQAYIILIWLYISFYIIIFLKEKGVCGHLSLHALTHLPRKLPIKRCNSFLLLDAQVSDDHYHREDGNLLFFKWV